MKELVEKLQEIYEAVLLDEEYQKVLEEAIEVLDSMLSGNQGHENSKQNSGLAADQQHYMTGDIQPIEIMQMYLTAEEFRGFLKGNVIKYSLRANFKGCEQTDTDKAFQYAGWLGKALRGEKINPRESKS